MRIARLPMEGFHLRKILDNLNPDWDEAVDWSLLLERESFFVLFSAFSLFFVSMLLRLLLGWYADHQLKIPRFRLREHVLRAGAAFFSAPEIK